MLAAALGLVILGIVMLFIIPWVGIPAAVVGVLLFVLCMVGFGRRAATGRP
jgi:hypothetical protein